jgi:hypothetical protein
MTGAGQPEYMITADDCESKVMINCVPMDEHSRQVKTLKKKKPPLLSLSQIGIV